MPRNCERTRSRAASPSSRSRSGESQQARDGAREPVEVARVDEQPALAVDDLVLDAADAAGDDGAVLPHRLGDGQPEALGEALLDDDLAVALKRVDDRRVLLEVLHRQRREVDALRAASGSSASRAARTSASTLGALGVVGDRAGRRPGEHEVGVVARQDRRGDATTPSGSFSASQRETWQTSRSSRLEGLVLHDSAKRSTRAGASVRRE